MISNLFFYGPIGAGKSTLIRDALLPHLDKAGGFYVQRIITDGRCSAFRLCKTEDAASYILEKEVESQAGLDSLFLKSNIDQQWQFDPRVFETAGVDCIQQSLQRGKKLLVMDELGGVELQCPVFMETVRQVLQSPTPVIGVLKAPKNARVLANCLPEGGVLDDNSIFADYLKNLQNTELYPVEPAGRGPAAARAALFIKGAL